jgi:hypothetical protein
MITVQKGVAELAPHRGHIDGTKITFDVNGHCSPIVYNNLSLQSCIGARYRSSPGQVGGLMAVHLVDDDSTSWYLMDLTVDGTNQHTVYEAAEFDSICDRSGSTITFNSNLTVYPGLYKNDSRVGQP